MEKFIVSARKYRPNNFLSLVGQESIAVTLKNSIRREQLAHAYLFCGPRGVGKTSTARIFAKTINCLSPSDELEPCGVCESCRSFAEGRSYCIHELDAASNNSVDDIRLLTEKVRIPPQIGKYSVYIIDEVHMLSSAAFNAFLKTLEEPPAHAIFILATTEKHKILPTILSRCQTYDFNRISVEDIVKNLMDIASKEGVVIDSDSLHVIAQKADGAMRDALTLFDQTVAFCGKNVEYGSVIKNLNVLDYDYYFNLVESALCGSYAKSLLLLDEVMAKGFNALYFISGLSRHWRNLLVCKESSTLKLLEMSPSLVAKYQEQSSRCSFKFLYEALTATVKCESDYRLSNNQRLLVEFLLVKLSQLNGSVNAQPEVAESAVRQTLSVAEQERRVAQQESVEKQQRGIEKQSESVEKQPEGAVKELKGSAGAESSLSIKNLIKMAQRNTLVSENKETAVAEDEVITAGKLKEAWKKMADCEAKPNLKSALMQTEPQLGEDGSTIIFYLSNSAQKAWIEKNARLRLTNFLQDELHNKGIKLDIRVKELAQQEKKLYMPQEKAHFLLNNYPEFRELHKELDLDLK